MKKLVLISILSLFISSTYSQTAYQIGDNQINFGIYVGKGFGFYGSYERGITDNISAGAELGIGVRNEFYGNYGYSDYNFSQSNYRFTVNGQYHFAQLVGISEEWDLYGGLDIGYSIWTKSNDTPAEVAYNWYTSSFLIGINGGARWFWNEQWGVNAEIGGGLGYFVFKTGLSVKLN